MAASPEAITEPAPSIAEPATIIFTSDRDGNEEIYEMEADGSNLSMLFSDPDMEDESPQFSADGQYLFMISWNSDSYAARVLGSDGTSILGDFSGAAWAPAGTQLLVEYVPEGKADLDLAFVDAKDPAALVPLVTDLSNDWNPDWCGDQILFTSDRNGENQIFIINVDGSDLRLLGTGAAAATDGDWSPDCNQIVYVSSPNLYIIDSAGGEPNQLTSRIGYTEAPAWSPDGTQIAFGSDTGGDMEIYVIRADGGDPVNVSNSPGLDLYPSWRP